jgi:hypothetical protein
MNFGHLNYSLGVHHVLVILELLLTTGIVGGKAPLHWYFSYGLNLVIQRCLLYLAMTPLLCSIIPSYIGINVHWNYCLERSFALVF